MTMGYRTLFDSDFAACTAASEQSTNEIDSNVAHPNGIAGGIFRIVITETFVGPTTIRVTVESDSSNGFATTPREEVSSPQLAPARLVAGNTIDIPLPKGNPALDWQRYWRAYYVLEGAVASAGKITCGIV